MSKILMIIAALMIVSSMFPMFVQQVGAENGTVAKPPIVSRTEWGCPDGQGSRWDFQYHPVSHIIIHHTTNPNQLPWGPGVDTWDKVVHKIWDMHALQPGEQGTWAVGQNGWGDIGYHYLIDPNGVIYEGRAGGDNVVGGHAKPNNWGTMGVAFLGTFSEVEPTPAALSAAEALIAWKCVLRGIHPLGSGPDHRGTRYHYIAGHRDVSATECPGDELYGLLPTIRQNVFEIIVADDDVEHGVPPGPGEENWSKPWAPWYVEGVPAFVDFEGLPDGSVLGEILPGVRFTTTQGHDWLVARASTGEYNAKYPDGAYTLQGDACAWLGTTQDSGIIWFTEGKATYVSLLTSTYSGLQVDAYDENDVLVASSGWATNNLDTGTMDRLTVVSPYRNIQYVIVHDTGNYWVVDCISTDAPGVGLELEVPLFRQTDPEWRSDYIVDPSPMFPAGKTIGSIGCAMTSACMVLASYGMELIDLGTRAVPDLQPLNPGTLNKWLKARGGYDAVGNLFWDTIDQLGYVTYVGRGTGGKDYNAVNTALEMRQPVILHDGGHFVVARGKYTYDIDDESKNYFVINDPAYNVDRWYDHQWFSYRLYEPSDGTVRPVLRIIMRSPAEMMITDALGRRTGYDPVSGTVLQEIPDSFYQEERPIVDPETGQEATSGYKQLHVIIPDNGPYQLIVFGTGTGSYELDIMNRDWSVQSANVTLHGTTSAGKIDGYLIDTSTSSADDLTVTPTTIEATVAVDPDTLNLQARGRWITAYIELPEEYAVEDIDVGTVQLLHDGNELCAEWGEVQDGVFMVQFDWATVAGWFEGLHDVEVELTVAGEVDGVGFEGTDTIRVIDPSRRRGGR